MKEKFFHLLAENLPIFAVVLMAGLAIYYFFPALDSTAKNHMTKTEQRLEQLR